MAEPISATTPAPSAAVKTPSMWRFFMLVQHLNRSIAKRPLVSTLGRVASVSLLSLALACGDDSKSTTGPATGEGTPTTATTGLYTLRSVNSKALPTVVYSDTDIGYTLSVTGGSLNLKSGSVFVAIIRWKETYEGVTETSADTTYGTWSTSGSTLSLTDDDTGDTIDASVTTGGITVSDTEDPSNPFVMVFKK